METVVANVIGKAKKATLNGRSYLVAPATLIVPGVLPGSMGRIYYPPDEVEKSAPAWNGMPLVGYHPADASGGFVSARTPEILEKHGLGAVYNVSFPAGKLGAELWYDEELTKAFDLTLAAEHRIVPRLISGGKIEISTGLVLSMRKPVDGEVLNLAAGVTAADFDFVGSDYRPDHVATLPDQEGACGIKDGCGVFNSDEKKSIWQKLGEMMGISTRAVEVTPSGKWATEKPITHSDFVLKSPVVVNEMSHEQLRDAIQRELKSRFTQDQPYCYVCAVFDDYFIYEQRDASYRQSYAKTETGVTVTGDPVEVVREVNYVPATEEATMNRATTIDWLVANCDCWKGPTDRETLNKLPDDKLTALKASAEKAKATEAVVNAAKKPLTVAGVEHVWDEQSQAFVAKPKPAPEPVPAPVANQLSADDVAVLAFGRAEMARQKQAMIDRLTANVSDPAAKAAAQAVYNGMKTEQLAPLMATLPPVAQPAQPSYFGAGSPAPVSNAKDDTDNLLPPMVFDFAEEQKKRA